MKKFITLVKRDTADYKGALIITPIVIAAAIFLLVIASLMVGNLKMSSDSYGITASGRAGIVIENNDGSHVSIQKNDNGKMVAIDENGQEKTITDKLDQNDMRAASNVMVLSSMFGALLPLIVSLIVVLFVLSGSLFDERKEKSIMFWKSLPVSDLETVGAKVTSIVGVGLGFAFLVSIALHVVLILVTAIVSNSSGLNVFNFGYAFMATIEVWMFAVFLLIAYALWAFPIYAWVLAASSYAPKAPFLLAFIPVLLLPAFAKIFMKEGSDFLFEPLAHLTAYPLWRSLKNSSGALHNMESNLDFAGVYAPMMETFKDPSLWIGLIVGVALLYAASEIRRRRSF